MVVVVSGFFTSFSSFFEESGLNSGLVFYGVRV